MKTQPDQERGLQLARYLSAAFVQRRPGSGAALGLTGYCIAARPILSRVLGGERFFPRTGGSSGALRHFRCPLKNECHRTLLYFNLKQGV